MRGFEKKNLIMLIARLEMTVTGEMNNKLKGLGEQDEENSHKAKNVEDINLFKAHQEEKNINLLMMNKILGKYL